MSSAERYLPNYTVADYQSWKGDWELLQGIPVAMTPSPFGPHQRCASQIMRVLADAVDAAGCHAVVLHELDWIVSDDTVVRPDVSLVCGDAPAKYIMQPPCLVVEVLFESTRERDMGYKKQLYQREGVRYYMTIDPDVEKAELVLFRDKLGSEDRLSLDTRVKFAICTDCEITWEPANLKRLFA